MGPHWLTKINEDEDVDKYLCPYPDSKGDGANVGPTWVLSAPGGSHVGPMTLAIRVV